jgi:hypothetical protein
MIFLIKFYFFIDTKYCNCRLLKIQYIVLYLKASLKFNTYKNPVMADKTTNALYELIDNGIKAAKEEFKKGFKAPQELTLDKKIEQIFKKDLLDYARSIRTHYHFLQEDAFATANGHKNALDYFREINSVTSKRFEDLDKSYATLAPALAKNIGVAVEIQSTMRKLANYQKSLKLDLSQVDDVLRKEALTKSITDANTKEKKEPTEEEFNKQVEDLSNTLLKEDEKLEGVLKLADEVDKVVNELNGPSFRDPLGEINFPALNINFQSFALAVDNLSKNLTENVKTFDKAKDTALADSLKLQGAPAIHSANEILGQLFGAEKSASDSNKKKSEIEEAQAKANEVQNKIDIANARLNALNAILVNKQLEEQSLKTYLEALDQTYAQIESLKTKKDHLNTSFGLVLGENNFNGLSAKLGMNVNNLLLTLKKLELVCETVSNMIEKLSAKDINNDVQEYLNHLNKALGSLGEPIKNLSLLSLNNIVLLEQLQSSVKALHDEDFGNLKTLFDNSALNQAKPEISTKAKKSNLDLLGLKSDLNSSITAIKDEIKTTVQELETLSQKSLIENNKVNFLKSIGVAA